MCSVFEVQLVWEGGVFGFNMVSTMEAFPALEMDLGYNCGPFEFV